MNQTDLKNTVVKKADANIENKGKMKNALVKLAERLDVSKDVLQKTLMQTAFKECKTTEDFVTGVIVANTYGLNPLLRELYIFPARGGGITPIVSIDGWISLVNRQQKFDGVELIENEKGGELYSVTAIFHLKTTSNPVKVTEYMDECFDEKKEPWRRWPRRMLRHKAYIQGARVAFGFSGIYDADEGERIAQGQVIEMTPAQAEVSEEMTTDMGNIEPGKAIAVDTVTQYPQEMPKTAPQENDLPTVEETSPKKESLSDSEYVPLSSNSDVEDLQNDIGNMLNRMGKTLLEYTKNDKYPGTDDVTKLKYTVSEGKKKSQLQVQHSIIKKDYLDFGKNNVPEVNLDDDGLFEGTEREPGQEG